MNLHIDIFPSYNDRISWVMNESTAEWDSRSMHGEIVTDEILHERWVARTSGVHIQQHDILDFTISKDYSIKCHNWRCLNHRLGCIICEGIDNIYALFDKLDELAKDSTIRVFISKCDILYTNPRTFIDGVTTDDADVIKSKIDEAMFSMFPSETK